jgi:hypothetical protein
LVISDAWIGPTGQAVDIVEGEDVAVAGRDEQLALIARQRPHRCHTRVDQAPAGASRRPVFAETLSAGLLTVLGLTGQNTGENRKIGGQYTMKSSTNADSIRVYSEIPRKK